MNVYEKQRMERIAANNAKMAVSVAPALAISWCCLLGIIATSGRGAWAHWGLGRPYAGPGLQTLPLAKTSPVASPPTIG